MERHNQHSSHRKPLSVKRKCKTENSTAKQPLKQKTKLRGVLGGVQERRRARPAAPIMRSSMGR